jgi:hypothetical protein
MKNLLFILLLFVYSYGYGQNMLYNLGGSPNSGFVPYYDGTSALGIYNFYNSLLYYDVTNARIGIGLNAT